MAVWDAADLLARVKRLAQLPTTDTSSSDADFYALLTEAQAHYYHVFAAQCPWVLMGAPTALSTADSGVTYTFTSSITPLSVELYDAQYRPMKAGPFWDSSADYVWEGAKIRFPKGVAKPATYYARYIVTPDVIDGSTAPTLIPSSARILLVYRAAAEWATRGLQRDPTVFWEMERKAWLGNPNTGDLGVFGMLHMQNPLYGATALPSYGGILDGMDTGAGYRAIGGGGG